MNQVELSKLDVWGWECPECKEWNETNDDPAYQEEVYCENCSCTFEPVEV